MISLLKKKFDATTNTSAPNDDDYHSDVEMARSISHESDDHQDKHSSESSSSDEDENEDDEEMILEIVKVLCKNGANVNAKNYQDCSPVDIALQNRDYRLLDHLIPFKASIPIWG